MKEQLDYIKKKVTESLLSGMFLILKVDPHTTTIGIVDEEVVYPFSFWISNGSDYFATYEGEYNTSAIDWRNEDKLREQLYTIVLNQNTKIQRISIDRLSNDLFFKVKGKTILTGYDDTNWWQNVAPADFKELGIQKIDGTYYLFNV